MGIGTIPTSLKALLKIGMAVKIAFVCLFAKRTLIWDFAN
jgi:hypothetical protein